MNTHQKPFIFIPSIGKKPGDPAVDTHVRRFDAGATVDVPAQFVTSALGEPRLLNGGAQLFEDSHFVVADDGQVHVARLLVGSGSTLTVGDAGSVEAEVLHVNDDGHLRVTGEGSVHMRACIVRDGANVQVRGRLEADEVDFVGGQVLIEEGGELILPTLPGNARLVVPMSFTVRSGEIVTLNDLALVSADESAEGAFRRSLVPGGEIDMMLPDDEELEPTLPGRNGLLVVN